MKKNTLLKTLFALIFVFLFIAVAGTHALELQYPDVIKIDGTRMTIDDNTTPTGYVVYVFYFLVALAGIIAFMVVVWGGFNLFMSGGEPGKVSEAKNKIIGAFIGLVVLFSIYIILGTINKSILEVKLDTFSCDNTQLPICVETTKVVKTDPLTTKVFTDMSIPKANDNLVLKTGESIVIKKYQGLQEIWGFEQTGFHGSPIRVYPNANTSAPLPAIAADIALSPTADGANLKSYKIIENLEGIYLYDQSNFMVGDGTIAPFYLNTNVPDFNKTNPQFFKKAQSIKVVAPRYNTSDALGVAPATIIFSEPEYRGYCEFITVKYEGNLSTYSVLNKNKQFGNNLASAIYFHIGSIGSSTPIETGSIVFYNATNCRPDKNMEDPTKGECLKRSFGNFYPSNNIGCGEGFIIKSIKINGPIGLVLMEGDKCQFFSKNNFTLENGNCISSILDSSVSNADRYASFPLDN